jgi:hypothetical protein
MLHEMVCKRHTNDDRIQTCTRAPTRPQQPTFTSDRKISRRQDKIILVILRRQDKIILVILRRQDKIILVKIILDAKTKDILSGPPVLTYTHNISVNRAVILPLHLPSILARFLSSLTSLRDIEGKLDRGQRKPLPLSLTSLLFLISLPPPLKMRPLTVTINPKSETRNPGS